MRRLPERLLLRSERPSTTTGLVAGALAIGAVTGLIYPLKQAAPVVSLGVMYLLAVLVVSMYWGAWLGVIASVVSAAAFNFFHLPPTGRFTIADSRNWVALLTFLTVGLVASTVAEAARARAREADERRREADLAAELARILLGAEELPSALALAARRLAEAFAVPSASIALAPAPPPPGGIPLVAGGEPIAWLVLPEGAAAGREDAVGRIVAGLESIVAAALARERLQREVVETASLRRSDELKTALIRSVSHDLRTPVTGILAGATALGSEHLEAGEREEVRAGIVGDAERLDRLIRNLLDLSRLEAGIAEPRRTWCSIDEVLRESVEQITDSGSGGEFSFAIDRELPLVRADAVQLERAFANLAENAVRHAGGMPVSVRARAVGHRLLVRIVDRGPGIPAAEHERIFTPFYQSPGSGATGRGSGLGLAIAKGFLEANGGRISVESLPGQGTTFAVEFPIEAGEDGG